MLHELNREYPESDEENLFDEMVKIVTARMARLGNSHRGQHAKPTGCVRGVFTIRDQVPEDLRYGVFRQANKSYQAIVRFSNAPETADPDGKGTARGIAVKLLDVDGDPAIPGTSNRCQDFLAVNFPVFPFATPEEYVNFFQHREVPVVGDAIALASEALFHPRHLSIVLKIRKKKVASPLEETYWSGSPYWLGPPGENGGRAVKYSLAPGFHETEPPDDPSIMPADFLRQALAAHLKMREAAFEFRVQPQTDPEKMPVEDVSIEWDEKVSQPIPVATLTISMQDVDSSDGCALAAECERMSFSPWNALAEHRPMGGINRLRKTVYLASQKNRGAMGAS
jgi:hypothetical protein